ncbi:hypothetical protein QUA74_18185 [Microcoleus sp. LAD1_D3]|uniref:hypothetical protein n=1 Tax=Microcoleus sp. LAD1_D3 TaxID=2819365 RepID=UPI002FCF0B29
MPTKIPSTTAFWELISIGLANCLIDCLGLYCESLSETVTDLTNTSRAFVAGFHG